MQLAHSIIKSQVGVAETPAQRAARIVREVEATARERRDGFKPGQLFKDKAGPRCRAQTAAGKPCTAPAYINGFCGRHGGGNTGKSPEWDGRERSV